MLFFCKVNSKEKKNLSKKLLKTNIQRFLVINILTITKIAK